MWQIMLKGMLIILWGVSKQRGFPDWEGSGKSPSDQKLRSKRRRGGS